MNFSSFHEEDWNNYSQDFSYINEPIKIPEKKEKKEIDVEVLNKNKKYLRFPENFQQNESDDKINEKLVLYFIIFLLIIVIVQMQLSFARTIYKISKKSLNKI